MPQGRVIAALALLVSTANLANLSSAAIGSSLPGRKAAPTPNIGDSFGEHETISGSTIVVGDDSYPAGKGTVYIFSRHGTKWLSTGDVSGPSTFGFNVTTSDSNVAVGTLDGSVYLYRLKESGPGRIATIREPDGVVGPFFGDPLTLSGSTLVAAAVDSNLNTGRVFVYSLERSGWKETAELSGSDTKPGDYFGAEMAGIGNVLIVSSRHDGGRVYVFTDGPEGWAQTAELSSQGTTGSGRFGSSVAMTSDTIVVGDPGASEQRGQVYVFEKTMSGWKQTKELKGPGIMPGDQFGSAVAAAGETIVIGASQSEGYRGTAYVFTKEAHGWQEIAKFNPQGTVANSNFGSSVAISGKTIAVGTSGGRSCSVKYGNGPSRTIPCVPPWKGGVYVYAKTGRSWREETVLHRP